MKSEDQKIAGFVIFGQGRSGSNLLRTLINSHPNLHCARELFNHKRIGRKYLVLRYFIRYFPYIYVLSNRKNAGVEVYGFKLFVFQLKQVDTFIDSLHNKGWKFIHIKRENTLKQVFSGAVGKITGKYVRKNQSPAPTETYSLQPAEIVKDLKRRKNIMDKEISILNTIPHLTITYEADLKNQENWQQTCNRIYKFLGLNPVEVSSQNLVSDPRSDSERIENFDEIITYLQENGFEDEVVNYYKWL